MNERRTSNGLEPALRLRCRRAAVADGDATAFHGEPGGRRFPALQQHRQPGRHRARLQGERGLDHRGLVEPVGAELRDRCCAARWSRASTTSTRSTTTAAANGPARPSCARATRSSPSTAPRTASRAASTAPASSRSTPASSRPGRCSSPNRPSRRRTQPLQSRVPLVPPPPISGRAAPRPSRSKN